MANWHEGAMILLREVTSELHSGSLPLGTQNLLVSNRSGRPLRTMCNEDISAPG